MSIDREKTLSLSLYCYQDDLKNAKKAGHVEALKILKELLEGSSKSTRDRLDMLSSIADNSGVMGFYLDIFNLSEVYTDQMIEWNPTHKREDYTRKGPVSTININPKD